MTYVTIYDIDHTFGMQQEQYVVDQPPSWHSELGAASCDLRYAVLERFEQAAGLSGASLSKGITWAAFE